MLFNFNFYRVLFSSIVITLFYIVPLQLAIGTEECAKIKKKETDQRKSR
jgi:hypothetical protein